MYMGGLPCRNFACTLAYAYVQPMVNRTVSVFHTLLLSSQLLLVCPTAASMLRLEMLISM